MPLALPSSAMEPPSGEGERVKCFVCKADFYLGTGGLHGPQNTPFCGPCEIETVKWLAGHLKRRWGKLRFYDHAFVPPERRDDGE